MYNINIRKAPNYLIIILLVNILIIRNINFYNIKLITMYNNTLAEIILIETYFFFYTHSTRNILQLTNYCSK